MRSGETLAERRTDQASPEAAAILPNNFDLIRLLAACQVMVIHTGYVFASGENVAFGFLSQAPGVPVFFFVSGFLISAAWENNPDPRRFALNRALRLVPAYLAVTLFTLIAILAFAHLSIARDAPKLALWLAAQLTLLCDWNPAFLRGYGDGIANGSLWTIPIEVCFYAATPFLYRWMRAVKSETRLLAMLITAAFLLAYGDAWVMHHVPSLRMSAKILALTPFPWLGMYLCGLLAQRHLRWLMPLVHGRVLLFGLLAAAVMVATILLRAPPLLMSGNRFVGVLNFATLALFALSLAYSARGLAARLLQRNDISYGIYLFHLPVANMLFANGMRGASGMVLCWVLAVAMGCLSWFAIEKPVLARRASALYRRD
jgi:peptidoglycan/LPS O-acetylase OafA/YrhL